MRQRSAPLLRVVLRSTIMSAATQPFLLSPFIYVSICPEGKTHTPTATWRRDLPKEWLFRAAFHGCRPCVQYCIEVLNVDPQSRSGNMYYTVMDWAQYAVDNDVDGAQEVVSYLHSEGHFPLPIADVQVEADVPPPPPPVLQIVVVPPPDPGVVIPFHDGRHLCKRHKPSNKRRARDPKYWMYNAAKQGCQGYVAYCVRHHGIPKNVASDTNGYTAEDFARYFQQTDVVNFLQWL